MDLARACLGDSEKIELDALEGRVLPGQVLHEVVRDLHAADEIIAEPVLGIRKPERILHADEVHLFGSELVLEERGQAL